MPALPLSNVQNPSVTVLDNSQTFYANASASTDYEFTITGNTRRFRSTFSDYVQSGNFLPVTSHQETIEFTTDEPFLCSVSGYYDASAVTVSGIPGYQLEAYVTPSSSGGFAYYSSQTGFANGPGANNPLSLNLSNGVGVMIPAGSWEFVYSASVYDGAIHGVMVDDTLSGYVQFDFTAVPEPSSLAVLGILGVALIRRQRSCCSV